MSKTRTATIICWLITGLILCGLAVWFVFGPGMNSLGFTYFGGNSFINLSGPFEEMGTYSIAEEDISSLDIDWISGDIHIDIYDGDEIVFTEYAQKDLSDAQALYYKVSGGTLTIRYCERTRFDNMPTKKLDIKIPKHLKASFDEIKVDTTSSSIYVSDFSLKTMILDTVSGEALLENITAETVKFDSTSGPMEAKNLAALLLDVDTVSGNVNVDGSVTVLSASTTSGSVSVDSAAALDSIDADTVSGDVKVTMPEKEKLVIDFDTVSGGLKTEFPVMTSGTADYKVSTVNGDFILKSR